MRSHSLLLTLGLAIATSYGLAQTGSQAGQAGQYPSSQSPTTQQEPSTQQMPPSTAPSQGQTTAPDQSAQSSNSNTPDNDTLAQQVQQKLATEPTLKNVQAEAKKGVITLSGTVASKADRKQAEELAKSVPGVKKVHSKLKVNASAAPTTSGAAETPAPSAAGSEAGNTAAQAGVEQGNREPGSMTSGTQSSATQENAENRSPETGSQAQQSPSSTQTQPGQAQPDMSQQGVQTPNAQSNNQMGTTQSATQIQSEIQNALSQQGSLSGSNIQVNVTDTNIELTGNVATPDQKQTAERIAGSYAGSRRVVNHITVSSLSGQTGETPGTTQPQSTMPGQGTVNPQMPPRQTPPPQQNPQNPPMSENPPQPHR
ncbi:MAG TPA: BON domain-containing protein [Terriglobales bacterium]|nr:BON domain-containing protein [Terriglobales bacterium]